MSSRRGACPEGPSWPNVTLTKFARLAGATASTSVFAGKDCRRRSPILRCIGGACLVSTKLKKAEHIPYLLTCSDQAAYQSHVMAQCAVRGCIELWYLGGLEAMRRQTRVRNEDARYLGVLHAPPLKLLVWEKQG